MDRPDLLRELIYVPGKGWIPFGDATKADLLTPGVRMSPELRHLLSVSAPTERRENGASGG